MPVVRYFAKDGIDSTRESPLTWCHLGPRVRNRSTLSPATRGAWCLGVVGVRGKRPLGAVGETVEEVDDPGFKRVLGAHHEQFVMLDELFEDARAVA